LKAAREKLLITYKGTPKILTADFSTEAMEDQAEGYSQCSKKMCQSRNIYPSNLSFKTEGKVKTLLDKQKLKNFLLANPLEKKY
jgi:hypothetical protein